MNTDEHKSSPKPQMALPPPLPLEDIRAAQSTPLVHRTIEQSILLLRACEEGLISDCGYRTKF